jgi:hypothetical protein
MEFKEQFESLYATIENLDQYIAELKAKQVDLPSDPILETTIAEQSTIREQTKRELRQLTQKYNQRMLSKLVRGGIEDDETMSWWVNRY